MSTRMRILQDDFTQMGLTTVENISPDMTIFATDEALMGEYVVLLPDITSDPENDQASFQSMLQIYKTVTSFPKPVQDMFTIPFTYASLTVTYNSGVEMVFNVPVFQPFLFYEPTNTEKKTYFETLFSLVLTRGLATPFYSLLLQMDSDAFLAHPGVQLLLVPQRRPSRTEQLMADFPRMKAMFESIWLQAKHFPKIIPIELMDEVLTEVKDSWLLPQEDEVKEYSLDRIPRSSEHCYPVRWEGSVMKETTPGDANNFIQFSDVPETFLDNGVLQENVFSVFVVYLSPQDDGKMHVNIAVARINFSELGSKHAHLVVNLLPERYHYLFSGEMIIQQGQIKYNLNSGMFYHLHRASGKQREFTEGIENFDSSAHSEDYAYVRSHFFPESLNWETMSKMVMEGIFKQKVTFAGNIRKPRLSITTDQIEEFCKKESFAFWTYTNKESCKTMDTTGGNMCV